MTTIARTLLGIALYTCALSACGGGAGDADASPASPAPGGAAPGENNGSRRLGPILGPVTDGQLPVFVGKDHAAFALDPRAAPDPHLLTDQEGNLFTVGVTTFNKYSPALQLLWSYDMTEFEDFRTFSVASDGGIFFSGTAVTSLPGEPSGPQVDGTPFVAKLASDGKLAWIHGTGSQHPTAITSTSDGAALVAGRTETLLQDDTTTVIGGPCLARYEADGTRAFLKQYAEVEGSVNVTVRVFVDASGTIALHIPPEQVRVDAEGAEIARTSFKLEVWRSFLAYSDIRLNAAKDAYYSWTSVSSFAKHTIDLDVLIARGVEAHRTMRDSSDNELWTGAFANDQTLAIAADAVFLVGTYQNHFADQTTTLNAYVGRYDLAGERIWFQEFALETAPVSAIAGIVLDPSGNPVIAAAAPGNAEAGYLFKVSRADGTLLLE